MQKCPKLSIAVTLYVGSLLTGPPGNCFMPKLATASFTQLAIKTQKLDFKARAVSLGITPLTYLPVFMFVLNLLSRAGGDGSVTCPKMTKTELIDTVAAKPSIKSHLIPNA